MVFRGSIPLYRSNAAFLRAATFHAAFLRAVTFHTASLGAATYNDNEDLGLHFWFKRVCKD